MDPVTFLTTGIGLGVSLVQGALDNRRRQQELRAEHRRNQIALEMAHLEEDIARHRSGMETRAARSSSVGMVSLGIAGAAVLLAVMASRLVLKGGK